jgi:hypothetical protein
MHMAKRKDWFYIVIALCMVCVVAVFVVLFVLGEKRRTVAVEELKTRVSQVEARYHQQRTKRTPAPETNTAPDSTEVVDTTSPSGDSIEAYNEFSEKQTVIDAKAILDLLFENKEEKSAQEIEEELAAFCAANQGFILELRNIAATGGPFHELDFSKGSKMELLPHLEQIRDWVRVLAKNGAMAAANGDYEEATKDALAIAGFAEGVGNEPVLISQIARAALDDRLYNLIAGNMQGENLSPEQAARIIEYAARFNGRNDLADAMAFDSTFTVTEMFDGIRSGQGEHANSFFARIYGSIGRPLLNRDEAIYVDVMERMSTIASLPYYEARPELERIQEELENISFIRIYANLTLGGLVPAYCRTVESCTRYEAQSGLMQIGLTVEQYHAQHGEYPQTLEEIAPTLGGTLPLDPYTGQNYVYKPNGDGFTLYSARGSVMPPEPNRTPRGVDQQGNIVWRDTKE